MDFAAALRKALPQIEILENEPLSLHTSFRIGGPARVLALPKNEAETAALVRFAGENAVPLRLLGGGSNVLVSDEGIDALIVHLPAGQITVEGNEITAGAGAGKAYLAQTAANAGLAGLEFAHGIPGTVGGGMYMNAGAYGGELVQVAVSALFLTAAGGLKSYEGEEMGLGYRRSAFMGLQGVIVSAAFRLQPGDPEAIQARMKELMEKRRASQPLDLPSAGSTFKRPVGGYAAALIQEAGLKGFRVGDAQVSEKHAGFVVNLGHATGAEVLTLIARVREIVKAKSGIELEPEVRIW